MIKWSSFKKKIHVTSLVRVDSISLHDLRARMWWSSVNLSIRMAQFLLDSDSKMINRHTGSHESTGQLNTGSRSIEAQHSMGGGQKKSSVNGIHSRLHRFFFFHVVAIIIPPPSCCRSPALALLFMTYLVWCRMRSSRMQSSTSDSWRAFEGWAPPCLLRGEGSAFSALRERATWLAFDVYEVERNRVYCVSNHRVVLFHVVVQVLRARVLLKRKKKSRRQKMSVCLPSRA